MNISARRGRAILRHRRQGHQVLLVVQGWWTDFDILYWVPRAHKRKPRGVS